MATGFRARDKELAAWLSGWRQHCPLADMEVKKILRCVLHCSAADIKRRAAVLCGLCSRDANALHRTE